jgi:hypothetical protein
MPHDPLSLEYPLPVGRLKLRIEASLYPPHRLFSPGCRQNPRRAFLFISHVLGKHLPTSPLRMAQSHRDLAALLPENLPTPCVFIGMAETATALGQGVFEAFLDRKPGVQALYLHTTRYRLPFGLPLPFEETHSHAPRQYLYAPSDPALLALFRQAQSLVLIDDEMSTGQTFAHLAQACLDMAPEVSRVCLVSLTDFTDGQGINPLKARFPHLAVESQSLLKGHWDFEPALGAQTAPPPFAQSAQGKEPFLEDGGFGRLGRTDALDEEDLFRQTGMDPKRVFPGTRGLVLGTGEFMYPPFRLAKALAQRTGAQVNTHATTRSPILPWGPIRTRISFPDPSGEGITNYLYNYDRSAYDWVILCHEHPVNSALQDLARQLGADLCPFLPGVLS